MRSTIRLFSLTLPALAMALTACASDSTAIVDDQSLTLSADDTLSAAIASAADATAGDIDVIGSAEASLGSTVAGSGGALPLLLAGYGAANCTRNASTNQFDCASVTANGLTLTRTFSFFDAAGQLLPRFNDSTAVSVEMVSTESGVRNAANGADTISRTRDFTLVGGLRGTTRTWTGTGTRTDGRVRTDSAVTRTSNTSDASTFSNVVVELPRNANPWPLSGTVTRVVTGTGTVSRNGRTRDLPISKTVVITFNGTSMVPVTVDGVAFTLDLSTGKAIRN